MGLEEEIKNADYVITGEGRIDSQTSRGKVVSGIAGIAKKYNKPVIAFCGSLEDNAHIMGIDRIYPITPVDMPLEEAIAQKEEEEPLVEENPPQTGVEYKKDSTYKYIYIVLMISH